MTNQRTDDLRKTYQKKIDEQTGAELQDESLGVEQLPQTELDAVPGQSGEIDDSDSRNAD